MTEPEPEYVVVGRISVEELNRQVTEAMIDAARMGIGEAILIADKHRQCSTYPEEFQALIDELRQASVMFAFDGDDEDGDE